MTPEAALRAILQLEGIVFASDDKERPMLAQSVVRRIAWQGLSERCAHPDCHGLPDDSVHGPVEDDCPNPWMHHPARLTEDRP